MGAVYMGHCIVKCLTISSTLHIPRLPVAWNPIFSCPSSICGYRLVFEREELFVSSVLLEVFQSFSKHLCFSDTKCLQCCSTWISENSVSQFSRHICFTSFLFRQSLKCLNARECWLIFSCFGNLTALEAADYSFLSFARVFSSQACTIVIFLIFFCLP